MADIDIVPKQRSYVWLWILLAIVILAVMWYAFAGGADEISPQGALQPVLDHAARFAGTSGAEAQLLPAVA